MKIELCKYCGGIGKIKRVGDNKDLFVMICSKCHKTPVEHSDAKYSIIDAIKIWNERNKIK